MCQSEIFCGVTAGSGLGAHAVLTAYHLSPGLLDVSLGAADGSAPRFVVMSLPAIGASAGLDGRGQIRDTHGPAEVGPTPAGGVNSREQP